MHETTSPNISFPIFNKQNDGSMDVSTNTTNDDSQLQAMELAPFINLDGMNTTEDHHPFDSTSSKVNDHLEVESNTMFTHDGLLLQASDSHVDVTLTHEGHGL